MRDVHDSWIHVLEHAVSMPSGQKPWLSMDVYVWFVYNKAYSLCCCTYVLREQKEVRSFSAPHPSHVAQFSNSGISLINLYRELNLRNVN